MNTEAKLKKGLFRKRLSPAAWIAVLGVLCAAFFVRWQNAEEQLNAVQDGQRMRAAEQLYESTCRIAEAVKDYRGGGSWKAMQMILCRSGISGKQSLSYLGMDSGSAASLNRFFSDAEGIADCEEEPGLLNEIESYTALLQGVLYRERNGYEAYSGTFFTGLCDLPYYRPGSDAVRADLQAALDSDSGIGRNEALAAARRYLGGSVELRSMVRGEDEALLYGFYCTNACVLIRKTDGKLYRLIREHRGGVVKKDEQSCVLEAKKFLLRAGYADMRETERSVRDNVCFLSFSEAGREGSIVRIGVTMSTGTVCAFSAADYVFD